MNTSVQTVPASSSPAPTISPWTQSSSRWIERNRQKLVLPFLVVISVLIFASSAPGFLSLENITNIARQSVYLMVVALAQMMVLIGGGLDLSVGSVVALSSVVGATVMAWCMQTWPDSPGLAMAAGTVAGLTCGAIVGVFNGIGSAVMRIPSFMVTLGMSSVVLGVTLLVSGGVPVYGLPAEFGEIFGFGRVAGIPVPVLIAILMIVLVYLLMEWTRYGRHLYAVGGNQRAAELSGIRTKRVSIIVFMLSGMLAALTGLLLTARLDTGESTIGATLPLESIAACVIAGVALTGGMGRTLPVVVGTLLIVLVQNGMNLMQVGAYAQTMVVGGILIVSMGLSRH
ncbi:ABC transporter permease [Betaproteobacteria bacterium]|nr:ABC transporter permease [Betaproteobacteria bacterium]GHT93741.1 ABC transporter permease [Betaproteobacteria bacterium]